MANICSFSMMIKGNKNNIETFLDMMTQKGTVFMGRGAVIEREDMEELEDGICRCQIEGWVKWSICASLVDDAISMRGNPSIWSFGEGVDKTKLSFVTLWEAGKKLNLEIECYSEEPGCCFQEHYVFKNGAIAEKECVEYREWYDETLGEWNSEGGFEEWAFEI